MQKPAGLWHSVTQPGRDARTDVLGQHGRGAPWPDGYCPLSLTAPGARDQGNQNQHPHSSHFIGKSEPVPEKDSPRACDRFPPCRSARSSRGHDRAAAQRPPDWDLQKGLWPLTGAPSSCPGVRALLQDHARGPPRLRCPAPGGFPVTMSSSTSMQGLPGTTPWLQARQRKWKPLPKSARVPVRQKGERKELPDTGGNRHESVEPGTERAAVPGGANGPRGTIGTGIGCARLRHPSSFFGTTPRRARGQSSGAQAALARGSQLSPGPAALFADDG